jgi:biotin carboxylase
MGGHNAELLIQSFLAGPQYIVNTVSSRGSHFVTDIWKMDITQTGRDVIPQGISLLDPETPHARWLVDYTLKALDALGIENGAAHSEVMLTRDGPALIETGARVMGAAMDKPSYVAAGLTSQAGVLASVLAGEALPAGAPHYYRKRHMSKVLFNFKAAAEVTQTDGLKRLATLASFDAHYRGLQPGNTVHRTADWFAQGGVIYLIHDSAAQIQDDIRQIRRWEDAGLLYGLIPIAEKIAAAA